MKKMKLLDLYKSILATAGLTVTKDGYVSMMLKDESMPTMVGKKRLVLPTPEHLANPDWKQRVVFHPLSENILRGESEVLETFRKALNFKLNVVFGMHVIALLRIATTVKDHSKLSPEQSEFLSAVKDADEKTLAAMAKIMDAYPPHQSFVSIYLRRGGSLKGRSHSRLGVVSFPIYAELIKGGDVGGVKLRVKDRTAIKNLMEWMIPQIDVPDSHNRGSDSDIAPFLDALMKSVLSIASPLNYITELFGNILPAVDKLMIEDDWVEVFDNLAVMLPEIRSVPMQAGNEGKVPNAPETQPAAETPAATVAPAFAATPAAAASVQTRQPAPLPWQQQTVHGVTVAPPPGPVSTGHGLDFASVIRSNPAMAQQVQYFGHAAQVQNVQQPPRWAMPAGGFGVPAGGGGGFGVPNSGFAVPGGSTPTRGGNF